MRVTFTLYRNGELSDSQCVTDEHFAMKDRVPPTWRTSVATGAKYLLSNPATPAVKLGILRIGGNEYEAYLRRASN